MQNSVCLPNENKGPARSLPPSLPPFHGLCLSIVSFHHSDTATRSDRLHSTGWKIQSLRATSPPPPPRSWPFDPFPLHDLTWPDLTKPTQPASPAKLQARRHLSLYILHLHLQIPLLPPPPASETGVTSHSLVVHTLKAQSPASRYLPIVLLNGCWPSGKDLYKKPIRSVHYCSLVYFKGTIHHWQANYKQQKSCSLCECVELTTYNTRIQGGHIPRPFTIPRRKKNWLSYANNTVR